MDTVILTNNVATPTNEAIKLVVKHQTETVLPKSENNANGSDRSSQEYDEKIRNMAQTCHFSAKPKVGCSPVDLQGQGDSQNVYNDRRYYAEKIQPSESPDLGQRQISKSTNGLANTSSTIFVPYLTKAVRNQDILEEMKKQVSKTFMKQNTFQPNMNERKSTYVPGTDYEYRTPGAHYKNKNGKIKRPMNAFMVWARDYRGHLASSMLNATNSEISVKLGQIWASMAPEEKKQYYDIAEKIKAKHRKDYPDWVYQPSAQTFKKKEETHIYTRTPTPPLNLMASPHGMVAMDRVFLSSLDDKVSGQVSGSSHGDQRIVATQSDSSDTEHESSSCNLACTQSNDELHQKPCNTLTRSTDSNPLKPFYETRVSYQSSLEIPKGNTVSDTTKGLLANKISQSRSQGVFRTIWSPTLSSKQCFQRVPVISTTAFHQVGLSTGRPVRLLSPGVPTLNLGHTQAKQQPRILGIVKPPLPGRLQVPSNVKLHTVRPSLLQDLIPKAHVSPQLIPYNEARPFNVIQNPCQFTPRTVSGAYQPIRHVTPVVHTTPDIQTAPGTSQRLHIKNQASAQISQTEAQSDHKDSAPCVPKDIPIVETHISPISVHVRSGHPAWKPCIPSKLAAHEIESRNKESRKEGGLQQPNNSGEAKSENYSIGFSETLLEGPRVKTGAFKDCWKKDEVDHFWPFPFSDNPADWDTTEVPSALYMELFDPYDPFLTADSLLTDTFPGSLQLDMEKWKRYLDDDVDGSSDPFKSLKDEETDNIIPSPLPLKQTLGRLLNAHVETSDTGDIITGDLVTEASLTEDTDEEEQEFDTRDLLTTEMAEELSCTLRNSYEDKQQIAEYILNSIIHKVETAVNIKLTLTETNERAGKESDINQSEVIESKCLCNEHSSEYTWYKEISEPNRAGSCNNVYETSDCHIIPEKSETGKKKTVTSLKNAENKSTKASKEEKCSGCAKIFNDCEIPIQGNTENGVASDEKNIVAGVRGTKINSKTSSDHKTKARNLRSRTRTRE